jgi:hypothetical protein
MSAGCGELLHVHTGVFTAVARDRTGRFDQRAVALFDSVSLELRDGYVYPPVMRICGRIARHRVLELLQEARTNVHCPWPNSIVFDTARDLCKEKTAEIDAMEQEDSRPERARRAKGRGGGKGPSKGARHDAPPGHRMFTNVGKGRGRGDGGGGGEGVSTSVRLDSIEGNDVRTSNQPGGGKGTVRTVNARPGTGMCRFFLEGCCNRGSACRYQHAMQTPAQAAGIDERVPHDLQGRNTGKGEGLGKGRGRERGEARPN